MTLGQQTTNYHWKPAVFLPALTGYILVAVSIGAILGAMTVLFAAKRAGGFGGSTKRPMEWPQPDSVEARISSPRGCQEEQPWPSKRIFEHVEVRFL